MDEMHLQHFLRETIRFMAVPEMKDIPIAIIKKLAVVPPRYLLFLAKQKYLNELPIAVRRQAWLIDFNSFREAIAQPCGSIARQGGDRSSKEVNDSLKHLRDCVGDTEQLFVVFASYCTRQSYSTSRKAADWGTVLRLQLMSTQDGSGLVSVEIRFKYVDKDTYPLAGFLCFHLAFSRMRTE
jgi:hypothetical protein